MLRDREHARMEKLQVYDMISVFEMVGHNVSNVAYEFLQERQCLNEQNHGTGVGWRKCEGDIRLRVPHHEFSHV